MSHENIYIEISLKMHTRHEQLINGMLGYTMSCGGGGGNLLGRSGGSRAAAAVATVLGGVSPVATAAWVVPGVRRGGGV